MFCLLLFCVAVMPCHAAMARAGGGGGGGGAGGGGGGGGTVGAAGYSDGGQQSSPISDVVFIVLFVVSASGGAIVYFLKVHEKGAKASHEMKQLEKVDPSWNFEDYKATIETIFYKVQNAWMERDEDLAKDCMSHNLYDQYRTKSEWMIVRHEKNILNNLKLREAVPVDIEDCAGSKNDAIWVYIKASAADYTVDDQTMQLKTGSKISKIFEEYWKLIIEDNRWVLDEIRQKDEVNLDSI